ncbi:unnamed protein product, partial [Angiostrongylus costaricensis]|uniref:EGF-like domain-containing protein n=1 Tax=Angiostrongylus costaricensis TaxID=334426 RepID=A0A0R3PNW8_ANGCS
ASRPASVSTTSTSRSRTAHTVSVEPHRTWGRSFVISDPCELFKCENNGECIPDVTRPSKFRCKCSKEYEGELCEKCTRVFSFRDNFRLSFSSFTFYCLLFLLLSTRQL